MDLQSDSGADLYGENKNMELEERLDSIEYNIMLLTMQLARLTLAIENNDVLGKDGIGEDAVAEEIEQLAEDVREEIGDTRSL